MADIRNNPDLDDVFSGTTSASSGPPRQVVQMWESEFRRYAKIFGEELANQKLQRGDISLRSPLPLEEFRRQQLVNRYGPEQAAVFIQERERQERMREADRQHRAQQALERQKHQAEQEQRKQGPLPDLLAELSTRQTALRDYYRQGGGVNDLTAKALRARVHEQERYVGAKYAGLSPQEQAAVAPAMQAVEQTKAEIEREEIRLRRLLNEQLKHSAPLFERLTRAMMRGGGIGGMLGELGPEGIGASALASAITAIARQAFEAQQHRIRSGGEAISPSGASSEAEARQLANMAESLRAGELQRQQAGTSMMNLRQEAMNRGLLNAENDPRNWQNVSTGVFGSGRTPGAAALRNNVYRYWGRVLNPFGPTTTEARRMAAEEEQQYYANILRQAGVEPGRIEQVQNRRNFQIPGVQGGITTALGYQEELQVNQLQRNDQTNEILQQILNVLASQNGLLTNIDGNTNGLENLSPQWAP